MGGKVALEYQLKHKDASDLILLAPFVEASNKFKDIKTKTLIIHGTADDVISIDNSRKLQKVMPNCQLIVIEGVGHSYRGKEQEAAKAIAKFLS
jgi:pimeloyl-ACP methyl ester carboxylesterase